MQQVVFVGSTDASCSRPIGRVKTTQLYWQASDGSSPAERLADSPQAWSGSWSPDGKLLVFVQASAGVEREISLLTLGPPRVVRPLLHVQAKAPDPRLSPDGRWLAYVSDESGQQEVYVRPFPHLDTKRHISMDGGNTPVWDPHGRELFYQIQTQPAFVGGAPRLLFDGALEAGVFSVFDVASDGRIVMIQSGESEAAATEISVVGNWFEELKRRVPMK
jgi:Tol biopolymer transport system component